MFTRNRTRRRLPSLFMVAESLELRTAPTANVFSNVSTESALRSDIVAAASNSYADNVIELSGSISLSDVADGQIVIDNSTKIAKTLTIEGGADRSSSVGAGNLEEPDL